MIVSCSSMCCEGSGLVTFRTLLLLDHGALQVLSRAFGSDTELGMAPLIDMCNHRAGADTPWGSEDVDGQVSMCAWPWLVQVVGQPGCMHHHKHWWHQQGWEVPCCCLPSPAACHNPHCGACCMLSMLHPLLTPCRTLYTSRLTLPDLSDLPHSLCPVSHPATTGSRQRCRLGTSCSYPTWRAAARWRHSLTLGLCLPS